MLGHSLPGVAAKAAIEAAFPALEIRSLEQLGEGWDHVALLVNDDLVFRVPSTRTYGEGPSVAAEVALLRTVAGKLPVAVPQVVHVAPGATFFGYRYLPGESLEQLLDDGRWTPGEPFRDLVVDVMVAIERAVSVDNAMGMGLPHAPFPRYPREEAVALRSRSVTPEMRALYESVLQTLPRRWADAMNRPLATMHADLGLDHWLVKDGHDPYALIDWSDSCVGPPEVQLATLMWHVPELVADVASRYAERALRSAVDGELVFACGLLNAMSDLGALLDEGDPEQDDVDWCIEFLETWSEPDLSSTLRGLRL